VPVVAYKSEPRATFRIGERTIELKSPSELVAWSYQRTPEVRVEGSELIFVGYGVIAPEYGWDDYKGLEVRGKTLVVLINDPPVPDPGDPSKLDDKMFGGRAMTYYGRYTYKCEMAARLGAAAVIIVHETGPAAYPWSVVVSTWAGENFSLDTPGRNPDFPTVSGWITLDAARDLFAAGGRNFEAMKQAAVSKGFQAGVPRWSRDVSGAQHLAGRRVAQRGGENRGLRPQAERRPCDLQRPLGPLWVGSQASRRQA